MHQEITPIPVRPWTLNGLSERLIVSHYENSYGAAVRALNAVRAELAALDAGAPGYRLRALKHEELAAMGSVTLHELYFGNLGGEGNKVPAQVGGILEEHFGSVQAWRREFVGTARSLAGGSGWVLLTYSRRHRRLWNQIASDHSQAAVDAAPVLVLDMYEHAYHAGLRGERHRLRRRLHAERRLGGCRRDGSRRSPPIAPCRARTPPTRACRRSPSRSSRPARSGRSRAGAGRPAPAPHLEDRGL